MPPEPAPSPAADHAVEPYAWRMLAVLMVVYVLNFVDRQLLTILAPDLKRDLGIGDAEFGFLYGTAFGVFYALFGIPLGKLADSWKRVRLMALGLALWSTMTALSGFAKNATVRVYDLTRFGSAWAQFFDHRRVIAVGDKADVLAVGFVGDGKAIFRRQFARGLFRWQVA